jgi:hypothetical protein
VIGALAVEVPLSESFIDVIEHRRMGASEYSPDPWGRHAAAVKDLEHFSTAGYDGWRFAPASQILGLQVQFCRYGRDDLFRPHAARLSRWNGLT